MSSRSKYLGTHRRLVLAFDVGTTFSGISYSILDPGQVPEIKGVTRFPGTELVSGASKIPTIIYYDQTGRVRAVGAEATHEEIFEQAEDEDWVKAEWFKLHLRSKTGAGKYLTDQIPPLPLNKTVVQVFADFLRYLLQCAHIYIRETHANGPALWESVEGDINFVLSHPNGWEGKEQAQMRKAAVMAGLIPGTTEGHARVSFVTEGEASLHFAIQNSVLSASMKKNQGIVIVDAGGGTIDISSYTSPLNSAINSYEEIAPPQCHFHGSVFVTIHAKSFLKALLEESDFISDLDLIVSCFDKKTKLRFRNAETPQFIQFGSTRDNDPQCNIRLGQLKVAGSDVAQFFEPSVQCIVSAIHAQRRNSHCKIAHVVLVGGFAASDWLFNNVLTPLEKLGLNVLRPENHVNKAVSDGAISFYLDHCVRSRVSKVAYGTVCGADFDPSDREHIARLKDKYVLPSGREAINHYFYEFVAKNTQLLETTEFRFSMYQEVSQKSELWNMSFTLSCYRGINPQHQWTDTDPDNYTQLCKIVTNLSHLNLIHMKGLGLKMYYQLDFEVVLQFGLTEMKAQIAWKEKGVEKRSPAKIFYDLDDDDDDNHNNNNNDEDEDDDDDDEEEDNKMRTKKTIKTTTKTKTKTRTTGRGRGRR